MIANLLQKLTGSSKNLSLKRIIILPFLLQILAIVGLVGYFSWRNGEKAVNEVKDQFSHEIIKGVEQKLDSYLKTPQLIVSLTQNNIRMGKLSVDNFPQMQQDFWATIKLFAGVRSIYFGEQTGRFIYSKQENGNFYGKEILNIPQRETYLLDEQGNRGGLISIEEYIPQSRPWYITTVEKQKNNWSEVYTFTSGELGITASGLIEDSQGKFLGVVGVDLILSGIDRFLQNLELSDNGLVFILERDGDLVASSTSEKPFERDPISKKEIRLKAIRSENLLLKETASYINDYFQGLNNIEDSQKLEYKLNNDAQLVRVLPYQDELGIDWLVVMVIPESDFMGAIAANNLNTIWLCLIATTIATGFGIYTSRKIAQPLANLCNVTSAIAKNAKKKNGATKLEPIVIDTRAKELNTLTESFNEMVAQLQATFQELENSKFNMERQVECRTHDLLEAKQRADSANKAKSEFIANMSHEFRTPLHVILGFTQIALKDDDLQELQKENLLIVKRSGESLLALINDVLEMSNLESGSVSLNLQPCNLYLLLHNLVKRFEPQATAKNIKLIFHIPEDLPKYIETDQTKLKNVLINLIDNGIKYTSQGAVDLQLQLLTDSSQTYLKFTVSDTGVGVDPLKIKSIFDPFVQHQSPERKGIGLGLSLCQQFVRLLGGEIRVENNPQKGSNFQFQIPVDLSAAYSPPVLQGSFRSISNSNSLGDSESFSNASYLRNSTHNSASEPENVLADSNLSNSLDMHNAPFVWIEKIKHAAIAVDSEQINLLIHDLPQTNKNLANSLARMVQNFEYDEILNLAESELTRRGQS